MVVDEPAPSRKRKAEETQPEEEMEEAPNSNKAKRAKISNAAEQIEDDVIVLWELITEDLVRIQFLFQVHSSLGSWAWGGDGETHLNIASLCLISAWANSIFPKLKKKKLK